MPRIAVDVGFRVISEKSEDHSWVELVLRIPKRTSHECTPLAKNPPILGARDRSAVVSLDAERIDIQLEFNQVS